MAEIVEQVQEREAAHVSHPGIEAESFVNSAANSLVSCTFLFFCFSRHEEKRIDLPAASQHQ